MASFDANTNSPKFRTCSITALDTITSILSSKVAKETYKTILLIDKKKGFLPDTPTVKVPKPLIRLITQLATGFFSIPYGVRFPVQKGKNILDNLNSKITVGSVILFDEYFNYPAWKKHEFLAWQEFCNKNKVNYEYLAFTASGSSVLVRVTKRKALE